jgi:hypothetical protein
MALRGVNLGRKWGVGSSAAGEAMFGGFGGGSGGDAPPELLREAVGEVDTGGKEPLCEHLVDAELALQDSEPPCGVGSWRRSETDFR